MNADSAKSIFVGTGNAYSLPLKMIMKRGSTNVSRKIVVLTAIPPMMPG